jgi:thioesterase domain-containing protein
VRLHRDLGLDSVFRHPTIRQIAKAIESNAPARGNQEYVVLNEGCRRAIFCFPPVVAMGLVYQRFAPVLNRFTLYSFNFIPDDDRLERYVETIVKLQPSGPYVLLGYSAGGNVAFEVAKALEGRGHEVSSLVLMDSFFVGEENPNRMSSEDCERYAQQTVDALLAAAPELQVDRHQFAATWAPRIERYYQYLDGVVNSGTVDADIHLIRSTRLPEKLGMRGDLERWVDCTAGRFSRHQGAGEHEHMLDAEHAPHNAEIVAAILEGAVTARAIRARKIAQR